MTKIVFDWDTRMECARLIEAERVRRGWRYAALGRFLCVSPASAKNLCSNERCSLALVRQALQALDIPFAFDASIEQALQPPKHPLELLAESMQELLDMGYRRDSRI